MTEEKNPILRFREAVRLMDAQRRILLDSRAAPEVTEALFAIIKHLHSLPDTTVLRIVDGPRHRESLKSRKDKDAAEAAGMTLADVERVLADDLVSRRRLEAIAVGRFEVPSGSLRSLGSIDQLREKISILVQNERAHETISSVAKEGRS